MGPWFRVAAIVLPAVAIASCGLLTQGIHHRPPPPTTPLEIPTSTTSPAGETTIEGEMRVVGPCLTLVLRSQATDPPVLPIWPIGFAAKGAESEGVVLTGPLGVPTNDAINSELLELHGEFIASAPTDASVLPECAGYRLFHVGRALNIAK